MRVRPPLSAQISRAAAFLATISVELSTSCSATHLLLTAVRRPSPLEMEVAPVCASRLPKKRVYPLSRSIAATCISLSPCLLEHDGKAPLLEQHAGGEVLFIGTGRRPPASSEGVPERPVRWDEAVAQIPGKESEGVACRVLLASAVPRKHRRGVCWGSQVPGMCRGHGVWAARSQGGPQGGQSCGDGPLITYDFVGHSAAKTAFTLPHRI